MSQSDQSGLGWASAIFTTPQGAGSASGVADNTVRGAIARAAQASGVDFSYLLAQARLESSLNPNAHAATSSASGLYQFTNSTWLQTLQKHGDALGANVGGLSAGAGAAGADPASRAQLMALRSDPNASAMMAAQLASDNQTALTGVLGRTPDASELYLAHFLGADGAGKFLTALASNPDQSAAALLPRAAASNRNVFFDSSGSARSLGQVMSLLRSRMDAAMQSEGNGGSGGFDLASLAAMGGAGAMGVMGVMPTAAASVDPSQGPIAQQFDAARDQMGAGAATSSSSMADTLQATFGASGDAAGGATPDFVRNAYGRLRALGL